MGIHMAKSSTARQERPQRLREVDDSLETVRRRAPETGPPDLDRLIHERIRLGIVSALAVNRSLTFNELKALLKTEYRLSAAGRKALERYLNHMEALIRATREG